MNHGSKSSTVSEFATTKKLLLEAYSVNELNNIDNLKLNNYYHRNNPKEKKILCLLCNITINENDLFEHTKSLTHGNNKMFYNLVKQRNRNGGDHFVILNANWVVCRYCNNVRFSTEAYQLCIKHYQSVMHLEQVRYCQNRINEQLMKKKRTAEEQIKAVQLQECKRRERLSVQYSDRTNSYRYSSSYSVPSSEKKHKNTIPTIEKQMKTAQLPELRRHEGSLDQYPDRMNSYSYDGYSYSYDYSKKPSYEKKDENMIPTWVWVGLCCMIVWRYFRSQ